MRNLLSTQALIVITTLALSSCAANSVEQSGWRSPSVNEMHDAWRGGDVGKYMVAKGDFNGDGVLDTAKLLVRNDRSAFGLFVFMSQDGHAVKTILLNENNDLRNMHAMGLETVHSGLYKTACGKGYWDCGSSEEAEVMIPYDAVNYFKVESANSYYYWDKANNTFKRVWISD